MKTKVLKTLFGDDSQKFAGFHGIVDSLISEGTTLTTPSALKISFGMATPFVTCLPADVGDGLYRLTFDIESAKKSPSYVFALTCTQGELHDRLTELNEEQTQVLSELSEIRIEIQKYS